MASSVASLSKQDFLYSYVAEYLDDDLAKDLVTSFNDALRELDKQRLPEQFQALRGRLQLALQGYYLNENELTDLRSYVQDPSVTATIEAVQIEELGRGEWVGTLVRRFALTAFFVALIGATWWKFGNGREQKFKPLEYLGYEALALEDDQAEQINLQSRDLREIRQYLATYPGLDFKPVVLQQLPQPWEAVGATVIDYEVAKVAVVKFEDRGSKEKLLQFSFPGELKDLPPAEPWNMHGATFQTYASDELNFLAWQIKPNVVSLLVGRRSAPDLAELAFAGTPKD